jgi:3-carboxy-cis,cis-muconate cycloisomerase
MGVNLRQGGDLLMAEALGLALAPYLGRTEAWEAVRTACLRAVESGGTLRQAILEDGRAGAALSPEMLERTLDPHHYLGSADALIDRALAGYRAISGGE